MKPLLWLSLAALLTVNAHACIWDADSLWHEKLRSHDLAAAILGEPPVAEDTNQLSARIQELEASRNEASADWWNNLAGAYLRLHQPATAVKLLEPVAKKFPKDYGLHANLSTAYHLLGRYADAEKEIARDLAINPDAHFGLEKYHLALLQYLMRDAKYQARHVYVDEFTASLFSNRGGGRFYFLGTNFYSPIELGQSNDLAELEAEFQELLKSTKFDSNVSDLMGQIAATDLKPDYRTNWNLATHSSLEAGVIYMAQMNPIEPACFEMLGIAAWKKRDYHLAATAFQKAIDLGSQKSALLKTKIAGLNHYIDESAKNSFGNPRNPAFLLIGVVVLLYIVLKVRDRRRLKAAAK